MILGSKKKLKYFRFTKSKPIKIRDKILFSLGYKPTKLKTELKYYNQTQSGSKIKNVSRGNSTILIKKNKRENEYFEKMHDMKSDISNTFKRAIRWKNLKWILENYKSII